MSGRLLRYFHTIKYLLPVQLVGQIVKPILMKSMPFSQRFGGTLRAMKTMIPDLDLNKNYLLRFDVEAIMRGDLTLLNETHHLDWHTWRSDASPLWRFNLHYFEYAISLGAAYRSSGDMAYYDQFKALILSWINANPIRTGDAWHPYTISMRIPNWLICFELFGELFNRDERFQAEVWQSIYIQYKTLLRRKEIWQLGNHYFENLKTVVFCSLLFGEDGVLKKHLRLFMREVGEEILPDGVHFELSLLYHKIILEDMLRMAYWLRQVEQSEADELVPVIQKMSSALASLEYGMGKTPLFNDSGDGMAREGTALLRAAEQLFDIRPALSEDFAASGYYKLYDGSSALMFDAGEIGPRYMTGHSHCDCLSFELSIDNKPLFVNSGTYQYQGSQRNYFRSTRAHNTLVIGEREQSECWAEHRVARRIRNVNAKKGNQGIVGSYINYYGDTHTRSISLADSVLTVIDTVVSAKSVTIRSYLHVTNGCDIMDDGSGIVIFQDGQMMCKISPIEADYSIHITDELANYAPAFGRCVKAGCIEFIWQSDDARHGYAIRILNNRGVEYD